ncbi:MAG: hypothetical protein CMO47_09765 [Verrucomicrobiales bacterium]|nr:hypothetical protein [Verrucomicrobiales bacterium]|tara:strand:+ start:468 stop:767 length:300 start_codon:yes stop_codon:yes gene_type:complete
MEQQVEPHRGTTIIVLGILGLVLCSVCGIIAWVMANKDIPKMSAGTMDPTGLQQTTAGKICGIISVVFLCVGVGIAILYGAAILSALGIAAASASEGAL